VQVAQNRAENVDFRPLDWAQDDRASALVECYRLAPKLETQVSAAWYWRSLDPSGPRKLDTLRRSYTPRAIRLEGNPCSVAPNEGLATSRPFAAKTATDPGNGGSRLPESSLLWPAPRKRHSTRIGHGKGSGTVTGTVWPATSCRQPDALRTHRRPGTAGISIPSRPSR
jgi:hypothetical protein